jgi:hypothetical protein
VTTTPATTTPETTTPETTPPDPVITRESVLTFVSTLAFAALGYTQGTGDWRSQLEGGANPFVGRPAPWLTIGFGLIVTVVVVPIALWLRQGMRLSNEGRPRRRPRWWWPLGAWWGAYGLAAAVVLVGGGPRLYSGTVRYEFGAPISAISNVAATCRTPVGQPDVVSLVQPAPAGLPELALPTGPSTDDPAFGDLAPFPLSSGSPDTPRYEPPNVPARPLPYILETASDGTTRSEPPIGFLGAYDYRLTRLDAKGMTGDADIVGTRWKDPFTSVTNQWVNLVLPNDPWPPRIDLKVAWSCDRASG